MLYFKHILKYILAQKSFQLLLLFDGLHMQKWKKNFYYSPLEGERASFVARHTLKIILFYKTYNLKFGKNPQKQFSASYYEVWSGF